MPKSVFRLALSPLASLVLILPAVAVVIGANTFESFASCTLRRALHRRWG